MRFLGVDQVVNPETFAQTPLVELSRYARLRLPPGVRLLLKLEMCQPTGSIKDRPAARMVRRAIESGRLRRGQVIVEVSSGNTAVALAAAAARYRCRVRAIVPAGLGAARLARLRMYGVEIDERPEAPGPVQRQEIAERTVQEDPSTFASLGQFSNTEHLRAHREETAPEIAGQLTAATAAAGEPVETVDVYCAGIGTGASLAGIAEGLIDAGVAPELRRCLADPVGSRLAPLLRGEVAPEHLELEAPDGIGASDWGAFVDPATLENAYSISRHDAISEVALLRASEGYLVGPCTGYSLAALRRYAATSADATLTALVVATDRGEFYANGEDHQNAMRREPLLD